MHRTDAHLLLNATAHRTDAHPMLDATAHRAPDTALSELIRAYQSLSELIRLIPIGSD